MYQVEDRVSHPGHGACEVADICELDLTGQMVLYYKLIPCVQNGASVYVPTANADMIGLRPLVTRAQAHSLMASLASADEKWHSDSMTKQKRYRSLFSSNTIESMQETLSVMSALIRRKEQKELGSMDKSMLENIQQKVFSELAQVLDISVGDAIQQAEELVLQP